MRKWLGRILTTLSLLLLLGTVGMWVRSQWARDEAFFWLWVGDQSPVTGGRLHVETYRNSIELSYTSLEFLLPGPKDEADVRQILTDSRVRGPYRWGPRSYDLETKRYSDAPPWAVSHGLGWQMWLQVRDRSGGNYMKIGGPQRLYRLARFVALAVPWWFLTLIFALAPARAAYTWRRARRRRRAAHDCPACGYDCRATPDGAGPLFPACPECGRPNIAAA